MTPSIASREVSSRIEQRTLVLSIAVVLIIVVGSLGYGVVIDSQAVILNGIFSVLSLISGGMSLLAAKLVVKPEDHRFPYGYAHIEPLVLSANGLMVLVICIYAFVNGIKGIFAGGQEVDATGVMVFGAVTGFVNLVMWAYESRIARRTGSLIIKDDAREWLIDAGFSLVTLVAFAAVFMIEEPMRGVWALYADPVMVSLMALLALPVPLSVLRRSMREVLMMNEASDKVSSRLASALDQLTSERGVVRSKRRVVKTGRMYFVEVDIVVGPDFEYQTVVQQDQLRERILKGIGKPLEEVWLTITFTTEHRWT
ncbi:MAG TPA: cation diffusion facilitator family transporter [Kiritimatiellia bacterium]|nr:cation diffusion facilitator family transporter [Kiritimatiellia bacterium]HMP34113.1 cation diffusion facilitator family transporter [Kiritimatiellia bacterium]